jgi:excisionase family DNA binding protein
MKLSIDLTPEQLRELREALMLTPAEIEAIALATVVQMKRQALQASTSLTVREFAAQARLDVSHVHKLIRQGRLEATKPAGGDRRITADAVAKYFAGGKHGNGA